MKSAHSKLPRYAKLLIRPDRIWRELSNNILIWVLKIYHFEKLKMRVIFILLNSNLGMYEIQKYEKKL